VTVSIPSVLLSRVPVDTSGVGCAGAFQGKGHGLAQRSPETLPQATDSDFRDREKVMEEMEESDPSLVATLARYIYESSAWISLLRFGPPSSCRNICECGLPSSTTKGKSCMRAGISAPWKIPSPRMPGRWTRPVANGPQQWEKDGLTSWDFGPLPESICLGPHLLGYPGLGTEGKCGQYPALSGPAAGPSISCKGCSNPPFPATGKGPENI